MITAQPQYIEVERTELSESEVKDIMRDKSLRKNHLYTVVDESGEKVPYKQREVQRDFDTHRHGLDVILKSRQHGFSTEVQIDMLDDALFIPYLQCGVIAHTKQDAQEIFQTKIRQPYEDLHDVIKKFNPAVKNDGGTLRLSNGSEIRVAVSFRSATTHRLHISEYGKICAKYPSRAEEIKTGTLPSIHPQEGGRITIESTAEGAAGYFYDLCCQSQADTVQADREGRPLNPLHYRFHFYPWWRDPKNIAGSDGVVISDTLMRYFDDLKQHVELSDGQRAWYSIKRDGAGGLGMAMKREHPSTVEEAFEQSVTGAVFGDQIEECRARGGIGFYPWVQNAPVYTFWDVGFRNATCVGFVQFIKEQVRVIDFYSEAGRGAAYHAKQVQTKPYNYAEHHFPHDVMQHEKGSGIVLKDTYQSLLTAPICLVERMSLKRDGIEALQSMFGSICFHTATCNTGPKEQNLISCLAYYRYVWDDDANVYSKEPLHDWCSDAADMMQQLAIQYRGGLIGGEHLGYPKAIPASAYLDDQEDKMGVLEYHKRRVKV